MNHTGDNTVRIGFFNLSQARCETGKQKPGVPIGIFCSFLIFVKGEPFTFYTFTTLSSLNYLL